MNGGFEYVTRRTMEYNRLNELMLPQLRHNRFNEGQATLDELIDAWEKGLPVTCDGRKYKKIYSLAVINDEHGRKYLRVELLSIRGSGIGTPHTIVTANPMSIFIDRE